MVSAELRGNGQADELANQGTDAHGPLDPDATWTRWADFAYEVYHFWRMVGPQFRERLETEPRVRLPAETPAEEADVGIVGMLYPEAPFHLGPRIR
eukprot:1557235-Amphidinium_carterae.1